jgi:hypothetical protein
MLVAAYTECIEQCLHAVQCVGTCMLRVLLYESLVHHLFIVAVVALPLALLLDTL